MQGDLSKFNLCVFAFNRFQFEVRKLSRGKSYNIIYILIRYDFGLLYLIDSIYEFDIVIVFVSCPPIKGPIKTIE